MTNHEKVLDYHKKFDLPVAWGELPPEQVIFRISLMKSEFEELCHAMQNNNRANIIEELTQVLAAVYGTAVEYGFDTDKAFHRTYESMMSKDPPLTKNGKLVKGPNYKPADFTDL